VRNPEALRQPAEQPASHRTPRPTVAEEALLLEIVHGHKSALLSRVTDDPVMAPSSNSQILHPSRLESPAVGNDLGQFTIVELFGRGSHTLNSESQEGSPSLRAMLTDIAFFIDSDRSYSPPPRPA
jgi:hypothetical protein